MASTDDTTSTDARPPDTPRVRRRISQVFSGSRELVRIVYRDPEHVAERLTLYWTDRQGGESRTWAQSTCRARPDTPVAVIAEELRIQAAQIARIDGAISGTPFFLALVPGYLMYLLEEMRMTMRTAALYGRDPRSLATAAEMLTLRGVHPNAQSAEAALVRVREEALHERPQHRRSLRTWIHSVYVLLVFGGFMSRSTPKPTQQGLRDRGRAIFSVLLAIGIWVTTWVLPVSFMIAMAWSCETHARQLGRRALVFYGGNESVSALRAVADQRHERGRDKRLILRAAALVVSVAIPIAFIAYADHVRNTTGVNWVGALGALVALSLVIAMAVVSGRR